MSALGTVSTMSLAAISDAAFFSAIRVPHGLAAIMVREHVLDGVVELMLRVGLAEEVRAVDKQSFHLVGDEIARRVEHAQIRPKLDGLPGKFTPAKDRRLQIDVGK